MAIQSFRPIEQLCSQHSCTVVRHGSPSVIMSADLTVFNWYFCSVCRIQYYNQVSFSYIKKYVGVYNSLPDLLKLFMSFSTAWLNWSEVFLTPTRPWWETSPSTRWCTWVGAIPDSEKFSLRAISEEEDLRGPCGLKAGQEPAVCPHRSECQTYSWLH